MSKGVKCVNPLLYHLQKLAVWSPAVRAGHRCGTHNRGNKWVTSTRKRPNRADSAVA
jgi:hypothetical protein